MCGICGYMKISEHGREPDISLIKKMASCMLHRGPDDEGVYIDPGYAGLGQRRLSIIDITGGHQPMTTRDGRYTITYNGECYNFQELRENLRKKNIVFQTRSDTEVVLNLYMVYGDSCVRYMRGFFSMGIWDSEKKTLFLARDRMGQKPLYYYLSSDGLYFASEIKSILAGAENYTPEISMQGLHHYITYQYIPPPWTIYEGIKKMQPSTTLTIFSDGTCKTDTYWRPGFDKKSRLSLVDAKEELLHILEEATRLRLISDVPLGAFLSGGVDSSIAVALMSKFSTSPVKTFSIGFTNEFYNELPYARKVSKLFNTDHHEFVVEPNAMEVLPRLVWHYDEPFADSSAIPTYYVSKETRKHVTVALSGDGGDESFAGYARYKGFLLASVMARVLPAPFLKFMGDISRGLPVSHSQKNNSLHKLRRFCEGMDSRPLKVYQSMVGIFSDETQRRLFNDNYDCSDTFFYIQKLFNAFPGRSALNRLLSLDLMSYLSGCLLTKVDVASMAVSLETRSPFLDHKVIDFAASLPHSYKLSFFRSKFILKEIFRDRLPGDVLFRQKKGFGIPIMEWFRGDLKPMLEDMLSKPQMKKHDLFKYSVVKQMMDEHFSGYKNHCYRLWSLLIFQLWHRIYIEKDYKI